MSHELIPVVKGLEEKINELSSLQEKLIQRIMDLEEENQNLKLEISEKDKIIQKSTVDIEYLTMSHKLADSPDNLIKTRRQIARLIRTIDNCISMLHEE